MVTERYLCTNELGLKHDNFAKLNPICTNRHIGRNLQTKQQLSQAERVVGPIQLKRYVVLTVTLSLEFMVLGQG